jgi:putative ABC transport system permease protein
MRHWDGVAVMRCLGATQGTVVRLYVIEMLVLALAAGLIGVSIGFVAQDLLARLIGSLVVDVLPPPSAAPLLPALIVGFVALLGFGLPPILRLREVAPARVLRRDVSGWKSRPLGLYLAAFAAIAALMLWQAGDVTLALWVMGGSLATLVALGGAAWGLVRGLGRLRGRAGVAWRFGLANVARRGLSSVAQVVALGVGIMVLLLLTLVRTDLLQNWQSKLPEDAPNFFLINIRQDQVSALEAFLAQRGIRNVGLYPMVRGRLTHINDQPVNPSAYTNPRAERLASREFNLSWAARPQQDNQIVEGRWWNADGTQTTPEISIEEGIAETLGIRLGDSLRYNLAGTVVEAPVTSLRSVQWDSFRPNFFVIYPPGVIDDFPSNWITSFHMGSDRQTTLTELVRAFPTVTVLDVDALMTKVREIMERVVLAVEYVFGFTVLAGIVVLYAAVQTTRDERLRESALLRTLGARRGIVLRSLVAEFAALGALAGVLAAFAASLLGYALGEFVFGFGYVFDPLLWILGAFLGVLGVVGAGLAATRGVLDQPPMQVLRADG